eukprot:scaffold6043_cov315-Pinguiococcus_pyrenoidosus.AAC.8
MTRGHVSQLPGHGIHRVAGALEGTAVAERRAVVDRAEEGLLVLAGLGRRVWVRAPSGEGWALVHSGFLGVAHGGEVEHFSTPKSARKRGVHKSYCWRTAVNSRSGCSVQAGARRAPGLGAIPLGKAAESTLSP